MKRRHIVLAVLLALVVAVPAALVHRLLYTRQGLEWVLSALGRIESVHIEVSGADGTLAGPLSFGHVIVDHAAVRVEAYGVRANPTVAGLFAGRLALGQASIDQVEVTIKDRGPQPDEPVHFLPAWLSITAHGAVVRRAGVTLKDGTRLHAAAVRGDLRMTRWRIDVAPLALEDPAGRLDGEVYLRGTMPLGLRGRLSGHWNLPDGKTYRFTVSVDGKLDRLGVDAAMTEPAQLAFSGNALDLEHEPRAVGTVRAVHFDGSPWVTPGRLPEVSGSLAVDASAPGIGIDGTLTSPEAGAQPIRLHGSATYSDDTLHVVSLRAWLPKSGASMTASGAVGFTEHAPSLAIQADWTALRWPLAGDPVVVSPSGSLTITGAMPYAFALRSKASGPNLPSADFSARGTLDAGQLVLEHLDAEVLHGHLVGSGRLSFAGDQAWQVKVDGQRLDLSALREDLRGTVDVAGEFEGRGLTATSPWTARLARLSGTLAGRALTGHGEIAHRDASYDLRDVRIANGASHVDINGRYGPMTDLHWSAELKSLGLLHPSLAGEVAGSGAVRGERARPEVTAELHARHLHAGGVEADSVAIELVADLMDRHDSSVVVQASGLSASGLRFDSARLQGTGRMADHSIALAVDSPGSENGRLPGFEAKLAATGSMDLTRRTWMGTLEQASFDFPDGAARLAQPVSLQAGAGLVQVTPLCLVTGEARLCAEGEWHGTPASWRVLYSAQDWPLRRLLTSLLGRREFDGLLQLSGWAEQSPGHDWIGGAAVVIDRPTVEIRRNKFRSDRTEIGGGRLDVYADEDAIRATADLQFAASTRLQGEVSARREAGRAIVELPLSGRIHAESSVLTALPLFVPEIDRSEGRLEAAVRVGGSLGEPSFDGDFHLRDGRLDLYRTNLSLTQAQLDGHFVGDTLTFDGRATTPKGPVTLNGRFTWPEGVMTGSMRLSGDNLLVADTPDYRIQASPDLVVSAASGRYVVTGKVGIPWARISPKDLSTSVGTSPDERIVGEQAPEEAPSPTRRVRMSVNVVLGDDVRVESYGLKAHLGGEVLVTSEPGEEPHGDGAIRVLDGEYKAFGVYVKIVKGVLSYDDAPLSRPLLDLVAQREIPDEDITVSVNVRGPIDNPFITLTSQPAMTSNEALSYLLTGRSINSLQSNEAASVNRAAETLAVSGGGLLLGSVGTRLGLDEVSVSGTKTDDTEVVLGKFLSPKLFVSYGISIAEAINTIKMRYTLNPRWALKAEAGLNQSADIEFKIER